MQRLRGLRVLGSSLRLVRRSYCYESKLPLRYYTEEQLAMQKSFAKLIASEINPYLDEWEAAEEFPAHALFQKLGQGGFLGVNKPVEYGGLGLDYKFQAALLEECGTIHGGSIPMAFIVQTDQALPPLAKFGSHELKKQFLQPTVEGRTLACLGVTESSGGSDVASLKTSAVRRGDDWVLNGEKMWVTNGMCADWMSILVNTSTGGSKHKNKSIFCLPLNEKGITRRKLRKMGMHASDTAQIVLEDVRLPHSYMVGEQGSGFSYQMLSFQAERLGGVLSILKTLDFIISETIKYTRERVVFGKPVLDNQVVHYRLAELVTEIEALRTLTYWAIDTAVAGGDVGMLAAMTKLKGGRLYREVSDSCLQYFGAMGYAHEMLISRLYRDGRLFSIGGGADEVMLGVLSKLMKTLPKK